MRKFIKDKFEKDKKNIKEKLKKDKSMKDKTIENDNFFIMEKIFSKDNFKFVILISMIITVILSYHFLTSNQESVATSRYGSSGAEVRQIQTKLKNWGYYNGSIDGLYGSSTLSAVKKFQKKNGLTADGIAGKKTLAAMGINSSTTSGSSSSGNSNSASLNLISRFVYAESRGEPYSGQVAVASVILNRVKDSRFPNTVAGVVYQSGAFTCVSDGQINLTPNSTAKKAAQDALNGWDPSYGAVYYFNPNTATNKWIWSRPVTVTIGNHRFCK